MTRSAPQTITVFLRSASGKMVGQHEAMGVPREGDVIRNGLVDHVVVSVMWEPWSFLLGDAPLFSSCAVLVPVLTVRERG